MTCICAIKLTYNLRIRSYNQKWVPIGLDVVNGYNCFSQWLRNKEENFIWWLTFNAVIPNLHTTRERDLSLMRFHVFIRFKLFPLMARTRDTPKIHGDFEGSVSGLFHPVTPSALILKLRHMSTSNWRSTTQIINSDRESDFVTDS